MAQEVADLCFHGTYSCSYCDSQHTQLEFARHKLTNSHVKNIQKGLFQRGFSSVCLVCKLALKDLRHIQLHMQEKQHTEQMLVLNNILSPDKFTCRTCGIAFFNELALEAHRLLGLHSLEETPQASPKLNELSKQLCGHCRTYLLTNDSHICTVCDVTLDGIQETVMHYFTSAHITRLRASFCMACKKEFVHVTDRESHLSTAKHLSATRKYSCSLEEAETRKGNRKWGYPCMLCMIWCNSWFCLEIHILEQHHNNVLAEYKRNYPLIPKIVFLSKREETGETCRCNDSVVSKWKEWREQTCEKHVWCHKCGLTLFDIEEANQHLNTHCASGGQLTNALQSINASGLTHISNTHNCGICSMSFKSDFMLNVHTACLEHHRRLRTLTISNHVYCCSSCGLLVPNYKRGDNFTNCEGLPGLLKDNKAFTRCLQPQSTGFHVADAGESIGVKRLSVGTNQSLCLSPARENRVEGSLAHFQRSDTDNHLETEDRKHGNCKQRCIIGEVMAANCSSNLNQTMHRIHNNGNKLSIDLSGELGSCKNAGNLPANVHFEQLGSYDTGAEKSTGNKNSIHLNSCVPAAVANSSKLQHPSSLKPIGSDDFVSPENKGPLPDQEAFASNTKTIVVKDACLGDVAAPVIAAATLVPLKGLQESLNSVTAVVTETLLSYISNLQDFQSASMGVENTNLKRLRGDECLEAALWQGLKSIKSENEVHVIQHPAGDSVRHSEASDNKERQDLSAIVTVTASAIPSGLFSKHTQTVRAKAQGSSAVETPDNASKQVQESADKLPENSDEMANQAVTGRRRPGKVDKNGTQGSLSSQCPMGDVLARPSSCIQSDSSLAKDSRTEGEGSMEERKQASHVNAPSHNSKSESNEEYDGNNSEGNKFLFWNDGNVKWWSDSDDSDSL